MSKITYANKVAINENTEIPDINKVTDSDMNEIKAVVNNNDDELITINTKLTNATTYSTDEIRVGTWIDGKPIYRKVIPTGQISSALKTVAHNISNINKITNIYGLLYNNNEWFVIPRVSDSSVINQVGLSANKTNVILTVGSAANFNDSNVILEYTKTTD